MFAAGRIVAVGRCHGNHISGDIRQMALTCENCSNACVSLDAGGY